MDANWALDSQSYGLECPHVMQELDVPVMTGEAQRYGDGGQDEWDVDLGGDMIAFCDVFREWQKSSNGCMMALAKWWWISPQLDDQVESMVHGGARK